MKIVESVTGLIITAVCMNKVKQRVVKVSQIMNMIISLTSSHSWDMKRPKGNNDWYYRFVKNEVIIKTNERITPEKILSMICLFCMRNDDKKKSNTIKKNRSLINYPVVIVQLRIFRTFLLTFKLAKNTSFFMMNTFKWFIKAVSHLSLIFSTHWCHHKHLMCTVGATMPHLYLYLILLFTESAKIKFDTVLNNKKKEKSVIHVVNSSFFLATCSFVKEEKISIT